MKATNQSSNLRIIKNCYIDIPVNLPVINDNFNGIHRIFINNLPDISDTKSASYADETIIGRSSPVKTFSQSDNRSISMQLHFFITSLSDINQKIYDLRAIQSAVYPRDGDGNAPYVPPPVCKIRCGLLLGDNEICVILKSYSVKFPTDVVWVENGENYLPVKFDVDTTWDVVYSSSNLPGQERIYELGV